MSNFDVERRVQADQAAKNQHGRRLRRDREAKVATLLRQRLNDLSARQATDSDERSELTSRTDTTISLMTTTSKWRTQASACLSTSRTSSDKRQSKVRLDVNVVDDRVRNDYDELLDDDMAGK